MTQDIESMYGMWGIAAAWSIMFGAFVLFLPLRGKADRRPAGVFVAFVIAFAVEMYGAPFSLYLVMWLFGTSLPEGVLWGPTLTGIVGTAGHYLYLVLLPVGGVLVVAGWARIYREAWSREDGEGRLVREGIYRVVRHPQYTGLLLISLSALFECATIPLLILWPVLLILYSRLARSEERELERRFGEEWRIYRKKTGMFLPRMHCREVQGR